MENLQGLLRLERVILTNKISKGVYEQEWKRVRVVSTVGKWINGYYEANVNYLRPHEALYLMEMCKLEVTFETVPMSIEQAYAIFLESCNDMSIEVYLVYTYLSRTGYFVQIHNAETDKERFEAAAKRLTNKEDEMIWSVLMEKLNLPVSADFNRLEKELYERTKEVMESFNQQISGKREENSSSDEPPTKKHKSEPEATSTRDFIDILKTEVEFYTYENIFKKFSFVNRAESFATLERALKFNFDIFIPKTNFKKSEDLPNYRIVVVK